MNPREAHQIANPEILRTIKICPEKDNKGNICFYCKRKLQGILIAQEKELNFLNEISRWHEEFSIAYIKMVDERREALKISNEDLRKVLK